MPLSIEFPTSIDSSMRNEYIQCERKGLYGYFRHLKPKGSRPHLDAGGAFAHGVEVARKLFYSSPPLPFLANLSPSEKADRCAGAGALAAYLARLEDDDPEKAPFKTAIRVCFAVIDYFREWPLETDPIKPYINVLGEPAVEYRFAVPIDVLHPTTGEPILYTGKFDMLASYDGGYWPVDEKTASRLGPTWSQAFDLRGQFIGYCWAVREQGLPVMGCIARGIGFLANEVSFQQVPIRFPTWLIDEWYEQLLVDVRRMIRVWVSGRWSKVYGEACGAYGGCQFKPLCLRPNPEEWIESLFKVEKWSPLDEQKYPATDYLMEAIQSWPASTM